MKKKILIALACIIAVAGVLCGIYLPNSEINNTIKDVQNIVTEQIEIEQEKEKQNIIITNETQEIVEETIEKVDNGEDISTTEIIESSEEEEVDITDEGALETDAVIEQENISYNGDSTGEGLSLLGAYQGLTYYSQADSRWASVMYSSIGDSSQTMKSSACGPTSAAMIVSSAKGAILPTVMANLAVDNGYRTANNGTAWAFFPFVADYFDFKEYYTTSSLNEALEYLGTDRNQDNISDYFIIASCGNGLFTTGGHYIALVDLNGATITVYDPYLYTGKFDTASRRNAGVIVSGNNAFVSREAFRQYANYLNFWIFSNDKGNENEKPNPVQPTPTSYTRYVATQSANLNVRASAGGTVIGSLKKGTEVTVVETDGAWSRITSPVDGWVSTSYLSAAAVNNNPSISYSTSVGGYYRLKSNTTLYSNSNLSGIRYNYLPYTQIKVISHSSANVDYIYVVKTRRYAYCDVSAYSNGSSAVQNNDYSTSIGSYYTLRSNTILYSNGNLSGTRYNYLPKTKLKVISHYSNSVDYIYIVKTGRYAYCEVKAFN